MQADISRRWLSQRYRSERHAEPLCVALQIVLNALAVALLGVGLTLIGVLLALAQRTEDQLGGLRWAAAVTALTLSMRAHRRR